jgi:hypothetical protein
VQNVAPTALIITPFAGVTYHVGNTVVVIVLFRDVGLRDTHTCSASWGDGTTSAGTVVERLGFGVGGCALTHIYATPNTSPGYTIAVTVTDKDGGSVTVAVTIRVGPREAERDFLSSGPAISMPVKLAAAKVTPKHHHKAHSKKKARRHRARAKRAQ